MSERSLSSIVAIADDVLAHFVSPWLAEFTEHHNDLRRQLPLLATVARNQVPGFNDPNPRDLAPDAFRAVLYDYLVAIRDLFEACCDKAQNPLDLAPGQLARMHNLYTKDLAKDFRLHIAAALDSVNATPHSYKGFGEGAMRVSLPQMVDRYLRPAPPPNRQAMRVPPISEQLVAELYGENGALRAWRFVIDKKRAINLERHLRSVWVTQVLHCWADTPNSAIEIWLL